ncbi:unnamed protein product [Clonostachys byssicola]|uniref:Uncharacterized protein n=1 Tax=Clonostachys byssicola TaxID=160290 RepID=A0A9N9U6G0_9HYPO|nr:unnamed protein product [Clonostachys byssicola]
MRVIQMITFLFAVSGFTAAQSTDENGLSRRQLAEAAREKFLAARDDYLAARDEYLAVRDLTPRATGPAPVSISFRKKPGCREFGGKVRCI